jgi:diguanylate cyclase (GGDEF)-like protein
MKILIADDDPTNRALLRAVLGKFGYEVEIACDGDEAWEALQRPDAAELAILDWAMPGHTGPEVCRRLRARAEGNYVYVILLTGLSDLTALVEGFEAGADDFVAKPFRGPELYARLRAGQRVLNLQRELLAERAHIENLATHDALTGLWNRRAILDRLIQELQRAAREFQPLGVIMMDLDHFKNINDNYGHAQGDHVLQEIARRLAETVRPYDSVGRYGGEEFLIFAPQCEVKQSLGIAERLRATIHVAPVEIAGGPIQISASFGVSVVLPGVVDDAHRAIEAADQALYRAKRLGRNRVECASVERNASVPFTIPVVTS